MGLRQSRKPLREGPDPCGLRPGYQIPPPVANKDQGESRLGIYPGIAETTRRMPGFDQPEPPLAARLCPGRVRSYRNRIGLLWEHGHLRKGKRCLVSIGPARTLRANLRGQKPARKERRTEGSDCPSAPAPLVGTYWYY